MRRLLLASSIVFLFAGCTAAAPKTGTDTYALSYNVQDAVQMNKLADASVRVVGRRLESMSATITATGVLLNTDKTELEIIGMSDEFLTALQKQLTGTFDIAIRIAPKDAKPSDMANSQFGSFADMKFGKQYFSWVSAGKSAMTPGKATAKIELTAEGLQKLQDLFRTNEGKIMGIFVRNQLMSQKSITATDAGENAIIIDGIPSESLAATFADDVNVGLHVTFEPKK